MYKVDTESNGKIFGIIPVTVSHSTTVDAQSGEITKEENPWWSAIVKEDTVAEQGNS